MKKGRTVMWALHTMRPFGRMAAQWTAGLLVLAGLNAAGHVNLCRAGDPNVRILVSFPATLRDRPVTGRMFLTVSDRRDDPSLVARALGHQPVTRNAGVPFFAVDVDALQPGESVAIDARTPGYPMESLKDLPAGDYYVQAVLNVYTQVERADGHRIWVHMDQWEGQHFNIAPGNLVSNPEKVRLDPATGGEIEIGLQRLIPPVDVPADTKWVKRVKIQSKLLSDFWGHPIYLGATVLLPKGYDEHPDASYPAVYVQGHFDLDPPFDFSTAPIRESDERIAYRKRRGIENGHQFYQSWIEPDFPRMMAITFQHPTPYFDDSYAVNSANNGPYADALLQELVPHLEREFRMIPQGYARVLTGGSTGGYEALALQVHHPKFFGGTWSFYPDPIDFRRLFLINIYEDENAFRVPGYGDLAPERIAFRTPEGQPVQSVRDLSRLQAALGSRGRGCEYLNAWEAAFGPVGPDGYPMPLWDKQTGRIDRAVARYWRDNGYDLGHYLKSQWPKIGKDLVGKIHLYVGDMDHYYFNLPVLLVQEILENTTEPHYAGSVTYGSPLKGHGWHPTTYAEFVRVMARHIQKHAPVGEETRRWHYE